MDLTYAPRTQAVAKLDRIAAGAPVELLELLTLPGSKRRQLARVRVAGKAKLVELADIAVAR